MKLKDEDGWNKALQANTGGYGSARMMKFAERWADAMEVRMESGDALKDIAEGMFHEANTDGITGYMYGAAVSVLSRVWEHGEALRRWHNVDTQIRDEGERANESGAVLNPALLLVPVKDDDNDE